MTYDGKLLARARAELDKIKAANEAEKARRTALVYRRVPEIETLDAKLRAQMIALVRLTISSAGDLKERIAELERENLDLQAQRAELLTESGFPLDYLDDIYSCPKCHDTGTYDFAPCECLERLYNIELTKELGTLLQHGDESFEQFDLTLYSNEYDARYGVVPREAMRKVYDLCRRWAESFPNVNSNLLLQGDTGLGKTYLSACIARSVAGRGFSVCYDSASAAFEFFEQQKFARGTEEGELAARRVERMCDCDLMILDDLGTEMITPMSQSALYTLINRRLVAGRRTIINTNCTDTELEKRYTAQIYSRIAGEFLRLPFAGRDIRLIKKGV